MATFLNFKESVDLIGTSNWIIKCSQIFPLVIPLGFQQCGHFVINGAPRIPQRHLQTIHLPERILSHTLDSSHLTHRENHTIGNKMDSQSMAFFFQQQYTFRFLIGHLP